MPNWLFQVATALSLCSYKDIHTNGGWMFHRKTLKGYDPWLECPETGNWANNDEYFADERRKFTCLGQPYNHATFHIPTCELLQLDHTLKYIQQENISIAYVGDSLGGELYVSTRCASERISNSISSQFPFFLETFLRDDIPCEEKCLTNSTLRALPIFKHPCWACKNGIRKSFHDFLDDPKSWHNRIRNMNITAVVVGSGAWYNTFQGIMNSTATYIETLQTFGPIFQNLQQHGTQIYWIGLPPHLVDITTMNETMYGYEWIHFEQKDNLARNILEPYGVSFIDTAHLLKTRKIHDHNCTADGLHWW